MDNIGAAGGYPHSLQVLGHNLIEVDSDGSINADDCEPRPYSRSAHELQTKEFAKMYSLIKRLLEKDKILI